MKKPSVCSVCHHAERQAIEDALREKVPPRLISLSYGPHHLALITHRVRHMIEGMKPASPTKDLISRAFDRAESLREPVDEVESPARLRHQPVDEADVQLTRDRDMGRAASMGKYTMRQIFDAEEITETHENVFRHFTHCLREAKRDYDLAEHNQQMQAAMQHKLQEIFADENLGL